MSNRANQDQLTVVSPSIVEQFFASVGENSFYVRNKDDSMYSAPSDGWWQGQPLLVDPDQRDSVVSGDVVIAKIEGMDGEESVVFRTFIVDGGKRMLKPKNPRYDIATGEFTILGKVLAVLIEPNPREVRT